MQASATKNRIRTIEPSSMVFDLDKAQQDSTLVDDLALAGYFRPPRSHAFDPLNPPGSTVRQALHPTWEIREAILCADVPRVQALLRLGAEATLEIFVEVFDERDYSNLTALSLAVLCDSANGDAALTSLFAAYGYPLSFIDSFGRSLLHFANSHAVCQYLLDAGVSPDTADNNGQTPEQYLPESAASKLVELKLQKRTPGASGAARDAPRL